MTELEQRLRHLATLEPIRADVLIAAADAIADIDNELAELDWRTRELLGDIDA